MNRYTVGLLVLSLTLAALLWLQSSQLSVARKSANLWEASARSQLAALEELQAAREVTERALAERESQIRNLASQRTKERQILREAQRADTVVEDWSRASLPDAVRRMLR